VTDVVAPYAMDCETVDGNDVVVVWDAFGRSLAAARAGSGPFLLECLTHRLRGHYEGDPGAYRAALAAAEWQEKDPILRLQRHGLAHGWFSADTLTSISSAAAEAVEEAVGFGRQSPFPAVDLIAELVYADG
jgi:acetoin:2,6-dichlorophenolindophenol oxidoreductase subunit alpha